MTVPFMIIRNSPIGQVFINFISVTNTVFILNQSVKRVFRLYSPFYHEFSQTYTDTVYIVCQKSMWV